MDETIGLGLIEELKNNPDKFGKSYFLLKEYFKGLSKDTLRELLYSENKSIQQTAVWITSELGKDSTPLMKEVVMLLNESNTPYTLYHALEIVANHAEGEYFDDFIKMFSLLENSNQKIRTTTVMLIISDLSEPRIHEAYRYLENKEIYNNSHMKGLLSISNVNALSPSKVRQMINSDDAITRKYGIIAAAKLYKKCSLLVNEAVKAQNLDVKEFLKSIAQSKNKNALTPSEITQMIDSDDAITRKHGIIAAAKLYKKYSLIVNEALNAQDLDVKEFSEEIVHSRNKGDIYLDETGFRLIEELKNDPEKFRKGGEKSYSLLEEYFKGFPIDTLRQLFYSENKTIRQIAIWITSELGEKENTDLMKEIAMLMNDDDTYIRYQALQIVAHYANGEYFDDFIRVFSFLEDSNQKIRTLVMYILSVLSGQRIHKAYRYLENKEIYNNSHKKGLLSLINVHVLTPSEITQMINSDDAITRKYGIIAAAKLYKKFPQILNEAVNAKDSDVKEFAKPIVKIKSDRLK